MADYKMKNNRLLSVLLVLLGNTVYALTVKLFLLPADLISCGTTGIALVVAPAYDPGGFAEDHVRPVRIRSRLLHVRPTLLWRNRGF